MSVDLKLTRGCCRDGLKLDQLISPFKRVVALEWWEGPVTGVAQCHQCGNCWCFQLIDHDPAGLVRAFLLRRLHSGALEQLILGYALTGKPSWPSGIWTPPLLSKLPEVQQVELNALEVTVLDHAGQVELVMATKHLVNGRVLGVAAYDYSITNWLRTMKL